MKSSNQHTTLRTFVIFTWFIYLVLLVYGTLYPIDEWNWDQRNLSNFLTLKIPAHVSRADLVMNIIVYIPFGFLSYLLISNGKTYTRVLLWTSLSGFLLSFCLEFLQQFLPLRVTSISDIFLNTLSTLIGAVLAYYINLDKFQIKLEGWKSTYVSEKPYSMLGITCVFLWAAAQLSPFVPSLDISFLRHGITPIWNTLNNPELFKFSKFLIQTLYLSSIVIILRTSLTRTPGSFKLILLFCSCVLIFKIPVLSRQLSIESTLGLLLAFAFLTLTYQITFQKLKFTILIFILTGYIYSTLLPGTLTDKHLMNWIPFAQQMNTLRGIDDLIEQIALFAAISFLIIPGHQKTKKNRRLWGSLFILVFSFSLEWYQQYISGRYSDITDVVVAISTWFFCALYPWNTKKEIKSSPKVPINTKKLNVTSSPVPAKFIYLALILLIILPIAFLSFSNTETDTSVEYSLPAITDLPSVKLTNFKLSHPRLPAPSYKDIIDLETFNKRFFRQHRQRAKKGKLYSRILIARVYPGEINLNQLFKDLMALQFSWRGNQQTKPIALAYDWLYDQWTPEQRLQLRNKVKNACDYQILVINDQALSPYNVYLYNSPLQAMVAAALAIHTDIPEAEDNCMRFTHDYWTNRVLPVWRQIMEKNGGWHEGGEYVGIGIGQAIYQIPAMWRNATGEDYFRSESSIKGFLNFLIYKTRPDGTHNRWGDGRFYDRLIPDQSPLAIEYNNKTAYNLTGCPKPYVPSSWPWGPLTSDYFCSQETNLQLPLTQHFAGLGMLVVRNSWSSDATYVVFKAGDNYWSHSHLDQGAFTLYKGGPLAIDSGLYGPKYGSDHHMNYSYQTIAHNVITVTDNEDNLPRPDKKDKNKSRPIANDGGQRRVGSGWGKAAPLDLNEWLLNKDTYHTGKIEKFYTDENFVVAIANLTPAYTNKKSGKGTFFDRTRRVDDYWRIFIYDRVNDLVVIHDNITSTNPNFTKRSIFHTINRPYLNKNKITARVYSSQSSNQPGGTLEATVLFPKQAYINIIGGKGEEFLVQNKNYDENGTLWNTNKKRKKNLPEPGSWRVEIMPPFAQKNDQFLTVYNPTLPAEIKNITIQAIENQNQLGCQINGHTGSHSFLFSKTQHALIIELDKGVNQRNIEISLPVD